MLDKLDHADLAELFRTNFGGFMQPAEGEIVYPSDAEDYALKLTVDDRFIRSIVAGPTLTDESLDALLIQIRKELLDGNFGQVCSVTLFSNVPVTAAFRYRDEFQIFPPPAAAPQPPFLTGWYPFTAEYRYQGNTNSSVDSRRRFAVSDTNELALVGLLPWVVGGLGQLAEFKWVMVHDEPEIPRDYRYLRVGYRSGVEGLRSNFTNISGFESMALLDADRYYSEHEITPGRTLELPENMVSLFDYFRLLSPKLRERFLRSCFWLRHARRLHNTSRSAVFVALLSAVESLISPQEDVVTGETCTRLLEVRRDQVFRESINRLVPHSSFTEGRDELFAVRSRLSHGSLLFSDMRTWSQSLCPDRIGERSRSLKATNVVQACLVNWLAEVAGAHGLS